ncbi:related to leucine permease transcriptional regulator [Ramularia collo-cygni]|uniref:Related to leucine permease transcriptional regulator n=1 Tax=Ramularia collo-cygni TaxID=112498 RepID=A0A2D3VB13_9PEZI|nr:related to leucine permease transcriptional regulator [Ramularia collo-cygni]CZT17653.1 related to leucine permease transcriptional regulator [Ramularia collo-cygni]
MARDCGPCTFSHLTRILIPSPSDFTVTPLPSPSLIPPFTTTRHRTTSEYRAYSQLDLVPSVPSLLFHPPTYNIIASASCFLPVSPPPPDANFASTMTAEPSFTPVVARRTLNANSRKPATPTQFPPAVVDYVQRAFFEYNRHKDTPALIGIHDHDIRKKLADTVNEAADNTGMIQVRDWSTHPLPHQLILAERQQAALLISQSANLANMNQQPTASLMNPDYASYQPTASLMNPDYAPGATSRKRKSSDQEVTDYNGQSVTPPWKKKAGQVSLAERSAGKSKNQKQKQDKKRNDTLFDNSKEALERRRQRFGQVSPDQSPLRSPREDPHMADANAGPIVGTCQTIEKNYFRLTAPPVPSTVRPVPVLEQALAHIKAKWTADKDYAYVCDQLKSLRQDLTVQRIKTKFTIKVYEVHARIALQMKDLGEYNQCQTQLRALYKLRLGANGSSGGKEDEFLAYRILYLIYTRNRVDMNNMLADLTPADKKGPFVKLALQVRAALASGNYHKFFKLYNDSHESGMVPYLMDMFIERERLSALAVMGRAYKPDLPSEFVAKELAFHLDSPDDSVFDTTTLRACLDFIIKHDGESLLQEKDGQSRFVAGKAAAIFENARKAAFGHTDIKGQLS